MPANGRWDLIRRLKVKLMRKHCLKVFEAQVLKNIPREGERERESERRNDMEMEKVVREGDL